MRGEAFRDSEQVRIPVQSITIAGRRIGPDAPPYIIAEVSANHGGDLARAKRIIDIAAEKGADAVKFQAYTADSMTLDSERADFLIQGDNPWKGRRLHALYQEAATPFDWFAELFAHAKTRGIPAFASVFGRDSLALLEKLGAPAYKIASFEAVDTDLIAACSATGKPVIIFRSPMTRPSAAAAKRSRCFAATAPIPPIRPKPISRPSRI